MTAQDPDEARAPGRLARYEGSIPAVYDRCLGPFLFEPYADDLARRVVAAAGSRVLELSCGTGIATRRLRDTLPAETQLVATDLSAAMIGIARTKLSGRDIHWRVANAVALPFKDAVFDTVVSQFGLMFLPDRLAGFREARRVLRPGGTFHASVWCALRENPVAAIADRVLSRMFDDDPPRFLHVAYGSVDAAALKLCAAEAGFSAAVVTRVAFEGRASSARVVAEGFIRGTPLFNGLTERGADLGLVLRAVEAELLPHGGEPFRSPLAAIVLAAS